MSSNQMSYLTLYLICIFQMEIEPADTEIDYSIIRDPIYTSVRSLDDYVNVMSIGTSEIKRIISEECDVILECKVCQSLFRSLPNFIAHKRVYCVRKFGGYMPPVPSHVTEDETLVLEPTDPEVDAETEQETGDVRPLFESVLDGTYKGSSMDYKVFTDALVKEQTLAEERDTTVVALDSIPGNPNAMFQSVDTVQGKKTDEELTAISKNNKRKREAEQKLDNIRNKIVKVEPQAATHSHVKFSLRNRKGTDTDDENAKTSPRKRSSCNEWKKIVNIKAVSCNICEQKYSCLKTLRFHVESIHQEKRRFYPCPMCDALFSQVWGTRRHVERRHHKSYDQWSRMVEAVKQSSFLVPVEKLDEHGRPKNYELSKQKRRTMAMAAKSKDRAVANLKKAAEKKSARAAAKVESDSSDGSDDEPLSKIGVTKSPTAKPKDKPVKKQPEPVVMVVVKKVSSPTVFNQSPGKTLKVKVSPVKIEKDVKDVSDEKGGVREAAKVSTGGRKTAEGLNELGGMTTTSSGKKVYKCYNCGVIYDIKGSLNKHINRGRCFKRSASGKGGKVPGKVLDKSEPKVEKNEDKSPEKSEPGKDLKREALASVLSPKQLRKVNSLMDRDNIKCMQCMKQFTALILLSRHVIRHLGIVRYKCKFCKYKSFNQGECMKHVRNSHKKNDAHRFVLNIDKDSDDTKADASCRGLSVDNAKFSGKKNSAGILKTIKQKSPGSGVSSGENPTSPGGTPTFNLHVAKRLFAGTAAKSGDECEYRHVMVKEEPPSPPGSRQGSVARSNSICSNNSDRPHDRKPPGIDSSNIVDPNSKNYNISTRNSPRMFDTKPYKRVDGMSALTTRHGTYAKPKDGTTGNGSDSAEENAVKKGKSDGYTTIKSSGYKTPPRDVKTAEQIKKEKDSSTEKLIEEIFG
jgi:uncharacterized C2H2 Zn-finger protein